MLSKFLASASEGFSSEENKALHDPASAAEEDDIESGGVGESRKRKSGGRTSETNQGMSFGLEASISFSEREDYTLIAVWLSSSSEHLTYWNTTLDTKGV